MAHDHPSHHHDHEHDHDHHHDHDHGHHHHESEAPVAPKEVRILYIDAVAGASGDMFLGALVDLGVDFEALKAEIGKLKVPGFELKRSATMRHMIAGTKVDVIVQDVPHPHRHLGDLVSIIGKASLSDFVKEHALKALYRLAEAEAEAHRMSIHEVHLHEVGGLDCLVDIVGTCIAIEMLAVDAVVCGPVSVGHGTVGCAHGKMPVPAPGTLGILKDFPIRKTLTEGEMTTPTGAALLATLATPTLSPLTMIPKKVGYGAGTKDRPEIANLLRVILAETTRDRLPKALAKEAHHHHDHDHSHDHHHHDHDHDHSHSHEHDHSHDHHHHHEHEHSHKH